MEGGLVVFLVGSYKKLTMSLRNVFTNRVLILEGLSTEAAAEVLPPQLCTVGIGSISADLLSFDIGDAFPTVLESMDGTDVFDQMTLLSK